VAENQKLGAKPGATLAQFGTPEAVVNRVGNFITGTYLDEEDVLSAESKQLADGRTYYVYEVGACTGAWWQLAVCAGLVAACRQGDRQGQQAGGRGAGREGSRELSGRCLGTMLMTSSKGMKQACSLLSTLLTLCSSSSDRCTRHTARRADTTWLPSQPRQAMFFFTPPSLAGFLWSVSTLCNRGSILATFLPDRDSWSCALQNGLAYLLTVSASEKQWGSSQDKLRTMVESFQA
jgi:hypothetical protein